MKIVSVILIMLFSSCAVEIQKVDSDSNLDNNSLSLLVDADEDGYCSEQYLGDESCPNRYVADCDDNDPQIYQYRNLYIDSDRDGYGLEGSQSQRICASPSYIPLGYSSNNTDCNDSLAGIHASIIFYPDVDGDGYGAGTGVSHCMTTPPAGYSSNNTDCMPDDQAYHNECMLFEDNFNDHSDWSSPTQNLSDLNDVSYSDGAPGIACSICPDGHAKYAGFYNQRAAWSDWTGQPLARINSTNARGGSGKAITFWHEPINSSSCDGGTYWCSGGVLPVVLSQYYQELFIRFFIRFQPGWVWDSTNNNSGQKIFRVSAYQNPFSMFSYHRVPTGSHHPVGLIDLGYPLYGGGGDRAQVIAAIRFNSSPPGMTTPDFTCPGPNLITQVGSECYYSIPGGTGTSGSKKWEEWVGDGNWHSFQIHIKVNDQGGYYPGNPNGIFELWVDGNLIFSMNNIPWADGVNENNYWPSGPVQGWNYVALGGNAYNRYYAQDQHIEQWYAVDDFVVSTKFIEDSYIISY